jgi:uncharacterized membrane protein YoaT (DUF817 family)
MAAYTKYLESQEHVYLGIWACRKQKTAWALCGQPNITAWAMGPIIIVVLGLCQVKQVYKKNNNNYNII